MICKYTYNGKTFNSELELDDYLLFRKKLKPKIGDAVFKLSDELIVIDLALKESTQRFEKAENTRQIEINVNEEGEPSDLDSIKAKGKYKGITDIIHSLTTEKNGEIHPVFPIYNGDNYWNGTPANPVGLLELYRRGLYTHENIVSQLPFVLDLLPRVGDLFLKVDNENTLQKIRERMELVWKQQALCGELIHSLIADFFKSKTKDGKDFSSLSEEELIKALETKIETSYYDNVRKFYDKNIIKTLAPAIINIFKEIKSTYGEDCAVYSEKKIIGLGYEGETNTFPVVGRIDLLVVSKHGKIGIFDFKCSPKEYSEFNNEKDKDKYDPAKILTFKYLLAAYRRLVDSIVHSDKLIDLSIIPFKFENFRWDTNQVKFDSVSALTDPILKLSTSEASTGGSLYNTIENNLNLIFPSSRNVGNILTGQLLTKVAENTKKVFKVKNANKNLSDAEITELIKERGGIKKNKITQKWEFKENKNSIYTVSGDKTQEEAEITIFNKLKTKYEYIDSYVENTTSSLRKDFREYEETGKEPSFEGYSYKQSNNSEDPNWLPKKFKKYLNTFRWELVQDVNYDSILDELGILMFRNKHTGLIDVIRVSDYTDPTLKIKFASKNRTTILGSFLTDDIVESDSNNQVLAGVGGNMELMETMFALNEMVELFRNGGVGNIEVISPRSLKGIPVTNELLLYNFKRLTDLGGIKNNFKTSEQEGKIKMVDRVSSCKELFHEILESSYDEGGLGKIYKSIKSRIEDCISDFDKFEENPNILRQKLIDLDLKLTSDTEGYKNLNKETGEIPGEDSNPEYLLHLQILYAISQLSGVNLLQLLEDHARFSLVSGIVGTAIDNPGTLQSKILNTFTDQVTIAYLNTRDNVIAFNQELRKKVEALKKSKGFDLTQLYTTGNQVSSLYMNMFDTGNDDFLFVNPWDNMVELTSEEREFLKFAILKINDNRIKNFDPANIEELIDANPKLYLRVPLVKGDLSSQVAVRDGWLNFIRARFAMLSPKSIKARYDKEANGLISEEKYKKEVLNRGKFWEALNDFDATENDEEYRERLLSDELIGGISYFEHNIETLLLKHTSAYKMASELNNIFPVLRALTLHLNLLGSILNDKFSKDIDYILTYVKHRIHNRAVENRDSVVEVIAADAMKKMMSIASKLALAFNPYLWYQFIDGLWKDITIAFKYFDDKDTPFTKEGLHKGWKKVMREDLLHLGNDFTMSELLNQQYGFNDMDANSYIDRIKTDNTGMLYHFWDVGFRFASRPDFYNRMTLFYAQMIKDGSLDAHKIVDGRLVYDWTLDKRFDVFAKYKGNDSIVPASEKEIYLKQKSAYITIAQQFVYEGIKNADGTLFELDIHNPKALPKAYSNKDTESFKAVSDRIYGYYSHEKKSMIHSYKLGALFMQMNTYWSAKKNLYALVRSYTQEGQWVDYEENGYKYCWTEDEDGKLIPKRIENPEDDTHVPVKIWKGRPLEGIMVTVAELAQAFRGKSEFTSKSGFGGILDLVWNPNPKIDPEIRRLYNANIRQLIADILIWLIIGKLLIGSLRELVKDHIKKTGNQKLENALTNTFLDLGTGILEMSTTDADFLDSFLGRGKDWTPFAVKSSDKLSKNILKFATGKLNLSDFLVRSIGAAKHTAPTWDYVKLNTVGKKLNYKY